MLTAEQILKSEDIADPIKVDVPEWNGHVYVKVMSGTARDRWELMTSKAVEQPGSANVRATLLSATICDKDGKLVFTPNQAANLGQKSAVALDRVYTIAQKINELSHDDIEELEKN